VRGIELSAKSSLVNTVNQRMHIFFLCSIAGEPPWGLMLLNYAHGEKRRSIVKVTLTHNSPKYLEFEIELNKRIIP